MLKRRQPHTHATCGFCLRPNIIRSKPHEDRRPAHLPGVLGGLGAVLSSADARSNVVDIR
jgi:hypothetical protein